MVISIGCRRSVPTVAAVAAAAAAAAAAEVLRCRRKVLCEFRHCLVCGRPCQKKTNSGWEIVGDKHTAVPSLGGWERYPSCADQTLTAGEVKKRVKARGMKVCKMKNKVDKLIQKKNNKETKYLCSFSIEFVFVKRHQN